MRDEDLQQRALAGAVAADDADHLAALDLEADVLERPERLRLRLAQRMAQLRIIASAMVVARSTLCAIVYALLTPRTEMAMSLDDIGEPPLHAAEAEGADHQHDQGQRRRVAHLSPVQLVRA